MANAQARARKKTTQKIVVRIIYKVDRTQLSGKEKNIISVENRKNDRAIKRYCYVFNKYRYDPAN